MLLRPSVVATSAVTKPRLAVYVHDADVVAVEVECCPLISHMSGLVKGPPLRSQKLGCFDRMPGGHGVASAKPQQAEVLKRLLFKDPPCFSLF